MFKVYPDYYNDFKCIAEKCKHNCCIGWEIDIDSKTYEFYKTVNGEFSKRLKSNIEHGDTPHFILGEKGRCPFLNSKNLCDIIINLGEENICDICKEHPRFHNEIYNGIESGLGLCCEEAGRIILSKKTPVKFIIEGDGFEIDEILELRNKIISVLQNREKNIEERIGDMLDIFSLSPIKFDKTRFVEYLLKLERLDSNWTNLLQDFLKTDDVDYKNFDEYIKNRKYEYEQLAVYFIWRHFVNSFDSFDMKEYCLFTAFSIEFIYRLGAYIFTKSGEFDFENQVEITRLFSSEIEYSEENLDNLKNMLSSF